MFETKQCKVCGQSKLLSEFSLVSAKDDSKLRWAPKCKACKNLQRRKQIEKIQTKRSNGVGNRSKRIIEPDVSVPNGKDLHSIQTNGIVKGMDFADLESYYGKQLSCAERHDMVQRFNEFIELLKDGYGAIVGCEVYVRKDQ